MPQTNHPSLRVIREHPFTAAYVAVAVIGWIVVGALVTAGVI